MSLGDRNPLGIVPNPAAANNLDNEWMNIMDRLKTELEQNAYNGQDPEMTFPSFGVYSPRADYNSQSFLATRSSGSSLDPRFVGLWVWLSLFC